MKTLTGPITKSDISNFSEDIIMFEYSKFRQDDTADQINDKMKDITDAFLCAQSNWFRMMKIIQFDYIQNVFFCSSRFCIGNCFSSEKA